MAHHAPPPPPSPPTVLIGGGADNQSQYPGAPPPCLHATSQGVCTVFLTDDQSGMGSGTLPFTGFDVLLYLLVGAIVILSGLALRWRRDG